MPSAYAILAAIGILFGATGYAYWSGYSNASDKCGAAALRSQIAQLNTQLASIKAAAEADRKALEDARAETERLEKASHDLQANISEGVCFPDGPDADRVRRLWGTVTVRPAGRDSR